MADRQMTVTLAADVERGLSELAAATGRSSDTLAAEAIEKFVEDERVIIGKVSEAIARAEAGDHTSWEEAVEQFRKTIARAAGRRRT